jgi:hypothetical protein
MFEDFYMPEFDAEYLNSPAFRRALAAAEPEIIAPPPPPPPPPPVYRPAVQSVEPMPVSGIGSAAAAAPAATPSVIEAAAPLTYEEREARRIAANTSPEGAFIAAPTDNRGSETGYDIAGQGRNVFEYWGGPVRVRSGDKILFSGEGEEGAVAAARFAQNLSDTKGKNASWVIEQGERTINPDGSVGGTRWISGPSDTKEGMGTLGSLAGFLLPIAAAIAAGPLGLAAQIAMGAAAGGVGAVLSGNDPLKAALIAGASAGIMNVSGANQAISSMMSGIGGAATTKAVEKAAEEVTEQIVVNGVSRAVQAAGAAAGNTLLSGGIRTALGLTSAPPPPPAQPPVEGPPIVVTAARPEAVTGADLVSGIGGGAAADAVAGDARSDTLEEENAPIVVTAPEVVPLAAPDVTAGIGGAIPGLIPGAAAYDPTENVIVNTATPEPIASEPPAIPLVPVALPGLQTTPVQQPDLLSDVNPEVPEERSILDTALDVADIATTVVPVVGGIVAGGGGGGRTFTPDTTRLNFTRSPLRQTLTSGIGGGSSGIGGTGALYPYTPTTYGRAGGDQETEFLFFTRDPVAGAAAAPAVVPASAPGKKEGGEIEDDMVKHLVEYHKNGGHQGPGRVKGIGGGQEDNIPAWLSDGEYVWSAQDVALLGDGSTDDGVRRLDKMRQMVRQQAGLKDVKKIAKPQKGIDKMLKAVGGLA